MSSFTRSIMKFLCVFLVLLHMGNFSCNFQKENFDILSFKELDRIDTIQSAGKTFYYKTDNYLITGYDGSIELDRRIDQFVCTNRDISISNYAEYFICFYKKSKVTNTENIKNNPRDLARHSQQEDLLFVYKWRENKFLNVENYNGSKTLTNSSNFECNLQ